MFFRNNINVFKKVFVKKINRFYFQILKCKIFNLKPRLGYLHKN